MILSMFLSLLWNSRKKLRFFHLHYPKGQLSLTGTDDAFLNIDAYESGEYDVPFCWGIGNIVSASPDTAILFLQNSVATKLRSPQSSELRRKMPTPLECAKQLSDGAMFCITPDELLLTMNQWQVGHEIEERKRTHNCLFCGKHVDGNRLVCSSHFTTEQR